MLCVVASLSASRWCDVRRVVEHGACGGVDSGVGSQDGASTRLVAAGAVHGRRACALRLAVTTTGTAKAGVKWWLIEAGGELAREKAATQTVKLTLEPALFDENGHQVELLIDAADHAEDSLAGDDGGEDLLDASG